MNAEKQIERKYSQLAGGSSRMNAKPQKMAGTLPNVQWPVFVSNSQLPTSEKFVLSTSSQLRDAPSSQGARDARQANLK